MEIGGLPLVRLEAGPGTGESLRFLSADILPGRGMMLLQARAFLPGYGEIDVLAAPSAEVAAQQMDGGAEDYAGNRSFAFGGAILVPYANRIQGAPLPARRIAVEFPGATATLPANWGPGGSGAYAMHGLMLAAAFSDLKQVGRDRLEGRWAAGNFGARWPSRSEVTVAWTLKPGTLRLDVTVHNLGDEIMPLGVGWHPYFKLPSGDRRQARLHLPARGRLEVGDYDAVLPTGRILPASAPYDFAGRAGEALGDLYLDDCFVDLVRHPATGVIDIEIADPMVNYGVRVSTGSPGVSAVQVYAPPTNHFIVVEPQFNWADPFNSVWGASVDTGMMRLPPGEAASYGVTTTLFAPGATLPR